MKMAKALRGCHKRWRLLPRFPGKCQSFCLPRKEGGDNVDFVTWNDLIQIALLVFTVLSCFYNKKR